MFLYGASGHAKVILDILKSRGINVTGLFDDNPDVKMLRGFSVLGKFTPEQLSQAELIISIGENAIRKKVVESLPKSTNYGLAIASSAQVSEFAQVCEGTVVMQGAIIQASTVVGKHAIINTQASVDHDCTLGDYVHVSPHACLCGNVTVGEGSQIGAGAVVIPGIKIGSWCMIGAGAVVNKDVPDNTTIVGNPGRAIG